MLIDSHMHLFPDSLAKCALPYLSEVSGSSYCTDGTLNGTLDAMAAWEVNYGVILHIATKDSHQKQINAFAKKIQDENQNLLCFGTVYPQSDSAIEELYHIKEAGLHGIKLHPDYQNFFFKDEQYFPIYETIAKLGLPLTIHAGWDPASPDIVHAPSADIAVVAKAFPDLTIIGAHMGGLGDPDEAEKHLAGLPNVYFDTALSSLFLKPAQYERLIRRLGIDRILFATDCPWSTVPIELGLLHQTGLTSDELDLITYQNACKLFHLKA
ncbi:amidohydrolase family protein [Oscillospiraceae bacterium PP1C4]